MSVGAESTGCSHAHLYAANRKDPT